MAGGAGCWGGWGGGCGGTGKLQGGGALPHRWSGPVTSRNKARRCGGMTLTAWTGKRPPVLGTHATAQECLGCMEGGVQWMRGEGWGTPQKPRGGGGGGGEVEGTPPKNTRDAGRESHEALFLPVTDQLNNSLTTYRLDTYKPGNEINLGKPAASVLGGTDCFSLSV